MNERVNDPRITIVLAAYKPNADWLREQLKSLNAQTYQNLELLICDDCPESPLDEEIVSECVTKIPYKIFRSEKNLGSNKTFERLTELAEGEYIAYCDQDDVWLPEKLSTLYELLTQTNAQLVCSDMAVINGRGEKVAVSITEVRKTHVFKSGEGLFPYLLTKNFVTGCTMLVRAETAKAAAPFVENMVHDHWIALCASRKGRIEVCEKPLVNYRIHGSNQTDFLKNSDDKEHYITERIEKYYLRMREIRERFKGDPNVEKCCRWAAARKAFAGREKGSRKKLWKLRNLNKKTTLFELMFLRTPNSVFKTAIKAVKKTNSK